MIPKNKLLDVLLSDSYQDYPKIERAYLKSSHKKILQTIWNEVIEEEVLYFNTVKCLSEFSLQQWAHNQRKSNQISTDDLMRYLSKLENDEYFLGIRTHDEFLNQNITLKRTDDILDFIRSSLNEADYPTLYTLHIHELDVSQYIIKTKYKAELLDYCSKYWRQINYLLKEFNLPEGQEFKIAFHNAAILMKNMHHLGFYKYRGIDIEFDILYKSLKKCVSSLYDFPYDKDIYKILARYSEGYSETSIANLIKRTRTYVRKKNEAATFVISAILWGYLE